MVCTVKPDLSGMLRERNFVSEKTGCRITLSKKHRKWSKENCKWTSFYIFLQLYINVGKSREDSVLFNLQYPLLVVGSICENLDSVTTDGHDKNPFRLKEQAPPFCSPLPTMMSSQFERNMFGWAVKHQWAISQRNQGKGWHGSVGITS